MSDKALKVHSLGEAYFYLMVTMCRTCAKGPLEASRHEPVELPAGPGLKMAVRCKSCGHEQEFLFDLSDLSPDDPLSPDPSDLPRVNPSNQPSRVIDLAQWLTLFEAIVRAADQQDAPAESRRLGYEAAQCLEEALKFFPAEAAWPDESAFFSEQSLRRFGEHKHLFARARLVEMRSKLPSLGEMQRQLGPRPRRKRRWWTFWRR